MGYALRTPGLLARAFGNARSDERAWCPGASRDERGASASSARRAGARKRFPKARGRRPQAAYPLISTNVPLLPGTPHQIPNGVSGNRNASSRNSPTALTSAIHGASVRIGAGQAAPFTLVFLTMSHAFLVLHLVLQSTVFPDQSSPLSNFSPSPALLPSGRPFSFP